MKIGKSLFAVATVLTILSSGALAAEQIAGKIVKLDKASHTITLQLGAPGQTVGGASAVTQVFTLKHDPSYDTLKVGDQVRIQVEEANGVREVTKFEK